MARQVSERGVRVPQRAAPTRTRGSSGFLADLDTQLMLQVREHSAAAAAALVRRNFERVARYITRVVRDPRVIEDLTQDVFLHVLKNAARYEPTARFATWLYRIATNIALNYLSQAYVKKRHQPDPPLRELDVADRTGLTPERLLSLDELRTLVSAAVGRLPVKQRIALVLFQFEELSYEQIAAVMDTSVESVRCLLKRARDALRPELDELR